VQELLVLSGNPRRRKGRRKGRSAAQKRAFRKMIAMNPRRRRRKGRSRMKKHSAVGAISAPRRRYRRSLRGRARLASRRGIKFLRANTGTLSKPFSMIAPALTGAVGAIAVSAVASRLPIPAMLQVGKTRYITQGALAIGLGMLASKIPGVGSGVAAKMAEGSLTVTLAELIKEIATENGINLGGMGYYLPGIRASAIPGGAPAPSINGMRGVGKYISGPGAVVPFRRNMAGFASTSGTGFNFQRG